MLDKQTQVPRDSLGGALADLPSPFACSWTTDGVDAARVTVVGELDIATTPKLTQTLREARRPARLVVLDLREVTFLDSAGVHAIVNESDDARRVGRRLVVLRAPPRVDRIFAMTGAFDDIELLDFDPATADAAPDAPAARRLRTQAPEPDGRPVPAPPRPDWLRRSDRS